MKSRNKITPANFVETCLQAPSLKRHYYFVDQKARQGEIAELVNLFERLCAVARGNPEAWQPGHAAHRIVEALALTPGLESAVTALQLVRQAGASEDSPRQTTSQVAAANSAEVLEELLLAGGDLEITALLLHEAVVRGHLPPNSQAALLAVDRLQEARHPLAVLPARLFDLEAECAGCLPTYGPGHSTTLNVNWSEAESLVAVAPPEPLSAFRETIDPDRAGQIAASFQAWKESSRARIEARIFEGPDAAKFPLALLLEGLDLESVPGPPVQVQACSVGHAFAKLFGAASSGGLHGHAQHAAYGRLLAWQSLAGIVGLDLTDLDEVAANAQACQWHLYSAATWHRVGWELSLAVWNPRRGEWVILAATDRP